MKKIDIKAFEAIGKTNVRIDDFPTRTDSLYKGKKDYKNQLEKFKEEIDELQNMMYAHNRYSLLLIFQAMDAAGKDSTIRHVMSGINAHGVEVTAFKAPSKEELDHDFMWRTTRKFPSRGRIGIFNRSYYEEVLIVKVHPKIIQKYQRIPLENIQDLAKVWEQRYQDISNLESYAHRNGTKTIKFFLNVSKEEQRKRFLARIDTPSKNWKFAAGDVEERKYWDDYMQAYEDAINATANPTAPWYLVPADDKKNMRLIVSQIVLQHLQKLDMSYPVLDDEAKTELAGFKKILEDQAS